MNKIGIIFAMEEELNSIKEYLNIENSYKIFELEFIEGKVKDKNCILVESGVGKVNAARATQILIDNFKVDYIFNIGVAGGVSNTLKVCDIVVGEKLVQHDFDITAFNHEKGYIPKVGTFIDSDEYLLRIAEDVKTDEVKFGTIASGDIFCTEEAMSNKIATKFNALCVEMEGAAIAQVCFLNNIPFLIIRSISDVPNNNNVVTYEEFLDISTKKVSKYLVNIIEELNLN